MGKTYKNGQREVRAYELLKEAGDRIKGWKRLNAAKLSPSVAVGLYTKIERSGGVEVRLYRGIGVERRTDATIGVACFTSPDMTSVSDWQAGFKKGHALRRGNLIKCTRCKRVTEENI